MSSASKKIGRPQNILGFSEGRIEDGLYNII